LKRSIKLAKHLVLMGVLLAPAYAAPVQGVPVTAQVRTLSEHREAKPAGAEEAVVWLTPADGSPVPLPDDTRHYRLMQKDKQFEPHLLVVPVGAKIDFPNHDPFFHNVFSLYEGKRFDLGLYESGSNRSVVFDRPGVSYIFCSIHSQMAAIVIALDTPYFAASSRGGRVTIPNVPPGKYVLHVWHEAASLEKLNLLSRRIDVAGAGLDVGAIDVMVDDNVELTHKNKYGRDYDAPDPDSPGYQR
jgi:plastocyanin